MLRLTKPRFLSPVWIAPGLARLARRSLRRPSAEGPKPFRGEEESSAAFQQDTARPSGNQKQKNIQQPTSDAEHRTGRPALWCWELDVRCWMLDVSVRKNRRDNPFSQLHRYGFGGHAQAPTK